VETSAANDPEDRVRLMTRREAFDADPEGFLAQYAEENRRIARSIESARARLGDIGIPGHLQSFITELCMENNVAGHRADLVMAQAARALAALEGAAEVTVDHIRKVSRLVLVHRRREAEPPPPPPPEEQKEKPGPEQGQSRDKPQENDEPPSWPEEKNDPAHARPENQEENQKEEQNPEDNQDQASPGPAPMEDEEKVFDIGVPFRVKPISTPKDRVFRRGSGRRSRTRVSRKQGRYVKSSMRSENGDIALDATLRAAAPHQLRRGNENGLVVSLTRHDIRGKIREKRIGNFLFFVVDASGSMGARGRMAASKGAVMSLLLDAYQKRDKVAMISFRRNEAAVNLPPTTSVDLAGKLLAEMPVGGRTPLSAGLSRTYEQVRNALLKDPSARPIAIFITDGKSNVALGEKAPMPEAMDLAAAMGRDERVRYIVVDTEEEGLVTFGLARRLAHSLGAEYFKTDDLKAESLVGIVKGAKS
jgi:magnesium chelatase subunit D